MVATKPTKSTSSRAVHTKRPSARPSGAAISRDHSRRVALYSRRTILTVIVLAMMAVVLAVLFTTLTTPERTVTRKIQDLASDYYENYFYDLVGRYDTSHKSRAEILENYSAKGFATISLKQLLYFDDERHIDAKSTLAEYCDLDNTFIRIYPDAPFARTDYHIEYTYSCAF